MPSLLITGASGFIGSFLVEEGLRRGFTVYAGIRATSSRRWLGDPRIRLVETDLGNADALLQTFSALKTSGIRFDFIIHNAGVTRVRRKTEFSEVNTDGTVRLAEALVSAGMSPEKFILMSSLAAWGPGDPVTLRPVSPDDPPHPAGLYGKSKLEAEEFIRTRSGLPYIILRPTGVYGPREQDYFTLYKSIRFGWEPYLGSREQLLTFIYVKDLARVACDALLSPVVNRSYFVSDGKTYTAGEFAGLVKSILGKKTIAITFPLPVVKALSAIIEGIFSLWRGVPLLNRDKYYILSSRNWNCDAQPLVDDLSFHPEYDLRSGLEETIGYCRQQGLLK
jgi:UDP-glucose 4-epimerase